MRFLKQKKEMANKEALYTDYIVVLTKSSW